ncbi:unnamed protein product [Onchocerca flexuosa]|uniref:START domain-containing protein n=1 Tax=Onchocerca flexuosa TaxID=387005 RepID=A0A183H1L9_9BILA|nr:unnamed protein product [Onchocerca flexuosa]
MLISWEFRFWKHPQNHQRTSNKIVILRCVDFIKPNESCTQNAFITMASEIKNRMGPVQQVGTGPSVRIGGSQPVNEKKSGVFLALALDTIGKFACCPTLSIIKMQSVMPPVLENFIKFDQRLDYI